MIQLATRYNKPGWKSSCWTLGVSLVISLMTSESSAVAQSAPYQSQWQGTSRFVSPQTWAHPLYAWQVTDDMVLADAAPKHRLHLLTHQVGAQSGQFNTRVTVEFLKPEPAAGRGAWDQNLTAGFSFGMQGLMPDYRHVLSGTQREHLAGIKPDGTLFIGDQVTSRKLPGEGPSVLELSVNNGSATLTGRRDGQSVKVTAQLQPGSIQGNLALHANASKPFTKNHVCPKVKFHNWSASGAGLDVDHDREFGPILWSQYTLDSGQLKLNVQFAPIGQTDAQVATLVLDNKRYSAQIDPMSRTALFRVDNIDPKLEHTYKVLYLWKGREFTWTGTVRAEPTGALKLAAFSCDHGYAFPQPKLVQQVIEQDPDLVFFAGDQIYENYGGLKLQRAPIEIATLDYLRKYYQFGWTWRDVLKDRPSVIIPDDHDVFQGNIWGQGGRPTIDNDINRGGYQMPAAWVNMVQRTQTDHLPDGPDPEPIEQQITVYFTHFEYAGIPFFVLEDRKFKTGPNDVLPKKRWGLPPQQVDVEGAELLGARQERALAKWAQDTNDSAARVVLSQTIFCKANTHGGKDLKKNSYDFDSNGWPQTARNRALSILKDNPQTIMIHGDQHFGILVRQGIEKHGDGPLAFMVPGTANGFPRAWWPPGGQTSGDTEDRFGNKFSVFAAANPERGSNTLNPRKDDDPETTAFKKGSGHGLVTIDTANQFVRFDMFRYPLDGIQQFQGFPVQLPLKQKAEDESEAGFVSLFDGKTLDGWKGGDLAFWRVEDGAITAGDLDNKVKHNQFLRTRKEYQDFELRLQFKLTGDKTNAGVQFRTQEIPDHFEVRGFQADLGDGWWGCLYDESRRRRILAGPAEDKRSQPVKVDQWNDYRIRCQGDRIQLWINGQQTVDYTETDPEIPKRGIIALQVHGNLKMEARYRNIRIKEL